jgi:chromosome segregation ATPase
MGMGAHSASFSDGGQQHSQSHDYSQLIEQITSLHGDLQRITGVVHKERDLNGQLQLKYDQVKAKLTKTEQKYSDAKEQLQTEKSRRMDSDTKLHTTVKQWKTALESQSQEFEKRMSQFGYNRGTQDLDLLKQELQAEIEGPLEEKLAFKDAKIEQFRKMFFNARREHDLVKAQFDQWVIDLDNENRAIVASHQHEMGELKRQLDDAEKRADEGKMEEELRQLKTEVGSLHVETESYQADNERLGKEKTKCSLEMQRLIVEHIKEKAELELKMSGLIADVRTQENRADLSQSEFHRVQAELHDYERKVEEMDKEMTAYRQQSYQKDTRFQAQQTESIQVLADQKSAQAKEKSEWQLQIDQAQGEVERLKREINSMQLRERVCLEDSSKTVESERSKGETRILSLQGRVQSLEDKLQESSLRETALLSQKASLEKRSERETGLLVADKNRLEREKDVLHAKSKQYHETAVKLKRDLDKCQVQTAELNSEYGSLQQQHRGLLAKTDRLETDLQEVLASLKDKNEDADRLNRAFEASKKSAQDKLLRKDKEMNAERKRLKSLAKKSEQVCLPPSSRPKGIIWIWFRRRHMPHACAHVCMTLFGCMTPRHDRRHLTS